MQSGLWWRNEVSVEYCREENKLCWKGSQNKNQNQKLNTHYRKDSTIWDQYR